MRLGFSFWVLLKGKKDTGAKRPKNVQKKGLKSG